MRFFPSALVAFCLTPLAFAGNVLVVGSGTGQIHKLQDAVILAADGDVILVKPGTYDGFRSVGRSVTVVADAPQFVHVQGAVRILDLPAPRTLVVSGLSVDCAASTALDEMNSGLYVRGSRGQVAVQGCTFFGRAWPSRGAAFIEDCAGLSLVDCSVDASQLAGSTQYAPICPGLTVGGGAHLTLDRVSARGSNGRDGGFSFCCPDGCDGAPGMRVWPASGSTPPLVFARNSTFRGGDGGDGVWMGFYQYGDGGRGGDGVLLGNSIGDVVTLGITGIGGLGGTYVSYGGGSGIMPNGLSVNPGQGWNSWCSGSPTVPTSYSPLSGVPRVLTGSRLVRDDQRAVLQVLGSPGEIVEIAVSTAQPTFAYLPAHEGILHVRGANWIRMGIVPPSGSVSALFKLQALTPSNPGATYFAQARLRDPGTGAVRLSNLHTIVEVDSTF